MIKKTHIHIIKTKDNNLVESVIYLKKCYIYIPIDNKFSSDIKSLRLRQIAFICVYCDKIEFNPTYAAYKSNIRDQA